MQTEQEPVMNDQIAAVIRPRTSRTYPCACDGPRRAPARIISSPAFAALSALARVECEVPLPRLERVVAGKQRLMELAARQRAARLAPIAVPVGG